MAIYNLSNNNEHKQQKTKKDISKIVGITLISASSVCFVALLTNLIIFLKTFLLGMFGLFSYPMFITAFVIGIALVNHKKYVMSKKYVVFLLCAILSLLCILHMLFIDKTGTFFEYIGRCYAKQITVGGIVCGILTAPIIFILNDVGAYIIFSALFIIFCALTADYILYLNKNNSLNKPIDIMPATIIDKPKTIPSQIKQTDKPNVVLGAKIESEAYDNAETRKTGVVATNIAPSEPHEETMEEKQQRLKEYLLTPNTTVDMSKYRQQRPQVSQIQKNIDELKSSPTTPQVSQTSNDGPSVIIHEEPTFSIPQKTQEKEEKSYFEPQKQTETQKTKKDEDFAEDLLASLINETKINLNNEPIKPDGGRRGFRNLRFDDEKPAPITPQKQEQPIQDVQPKIQKNIRYIAPPLDLLTVESMDVSEISADIVQKREQLEIALDTFGIPAKVINVVVGPAVTRYELEMPAGVSVKKVLSHSDDIALNLASNGDIRIEAPIPGKSAVGIEVPNNTIATVGMREMLESDEFKNAKSPLTFVLGKDINGTVRTCNLQKMPHLLIAGATNSGKSVCLNAIIISLIYRTSPDDVRLILVDPKCVEFTMYNNLPHLLLPNVITDGEKTLNALSWAVAEMERRYQLFQKTKTRNLDEYKVCSDVLEGRSEKLPFIVIIIDELADLLMTAKKDVEDKIMRLAQKARAAGIHMILATQRPSVDVITGTIKANFPSRITFSLTSFSDSKTILDQGGAEKLLGKGDMLYKPSDAAEPRRIQGCYITGSEVDNIVNYVKERNKDYDYDSEIETQILNPPKTEIPDTVNAVETNEKGVDPLMAQVLKMFIENGQASTSMIQRRFVVGYPRASRIMDQLQQAGYISAPDGSKPRSVFMTMEEFEELFGEEN
ncbi:MAG: hypothetical protein IJA69_04830 [Clostridia bacterium]|nr:hypothetical protein [Clostridia bacterium]